MGAIGLKTIEYSGTGWDSAVEQHVPIHGRVGTQEEFLKIIGNIPALASGE